MGNACSNCTSKDEESQYEMNSLSQDGTGATHNSTKGNAMANAGAL